MPTDIRLEDTHEYDPVCFGYMINHVCYVMLYALSVTIRYWSNLGDGHWVVFKNILKYLRWTKDVFLVYGDEDLIVSKFIDANF